VAPSRLIALLDALLAAEVEFVVIGGLAAVLHGAPLVTSDVDIVHRRTPENIARLLRVLPPTESALAGRGHILLDTDWGAVDVLCEIGDGQDYEWLQTRSELIERGGRSVRIVSLPALIELKRAANRPKDRLAIPILLATLEARTRDP
jgi:hypothetical protein